ncbi:hypothetical protein D9619_010009 [Psilocybe cf. subviscida]|uniref:EF-hand domain-containing protein n=1 Tax=Psilocybe cf. subviscida TaxID=2480587 RepID=A0A8H5BL41_9AGAR|nr:hypothetical protein D9619_010009 [Psilocybe cf. subviscida]
MQDLMKNHSVCSFARLEATRMPPPGASRAGGSRSIVHEGTNENERRDKFWRKFDSIYDEYKETLDKYTQSSGGARRDKIAEMEKRIDAFTETMKVVLDVLTELGKIHPIISVAVVAFRGVLSVDISRRENDRKVIVILLEMQNMMCAMFELRHLRRAPNKDQEPEGERGIGIESANFRQLIGGITADIKRCGNDVNFYLSQNAALKFLKAKNFESVFKTHVETFSQRRSELTLAITTYVAGGVDQLTSTTGEISDNVQTLDFKVAVIFDALMRKFDTREEREASKLIEAHGGNVDECLAQDEALAKLLSILGSVVPESQTQARSAKAESGNDTVKMSRQILQDEMGKDFNESLFQNSLRFEKLLTMQEVSNDPVIAQLTQQGMYQEFTLEKLDQLISYLRPRDADIEDPELRRIWDDMGLKTSVKAKKFVLKFRDHYQNAQSRKVSASDSKRKSEAPREPVNSAVGPDDLLRQWMEAGTKRGLEAPQEPVNSIIESDGLLRQWLEADIDAAKRGFEAPREPVYNTIGSESSDDLVLQLQNEFNAAKRKLEALREPVNSEVDGHLLKYIDAAHSRGIIEAMDIDGSGYISVKELNQFCRLKPKAWSLLQWMAYWAAGWHINVIHYRDRIYDLLIQMHEALPLIHFANRALVDQYLDSDPLAKIEGVLRFTKDVGMEENDDILKQHATQYREIQENFIIETLELLFYIISSRDVPLFDNDQRMESWMYPLLYLVLTRHLGVIKLARWCVLDEYEMSIHHQTLETIFSLVGAWTSFVQATFAQVTSSVAGRFETHAYGMLYASYMGDKEVSAAKNTLTKIRVKKSEKEILQNFYKEAPTDYHPHKGILAFEATPELEYTPTNTNHLTELPPGHTIAGYWSGIQFFPKDEDSSFMGVFHLIVTVSTDGILSGSGEAHVGYLSLSGTVSGSTFHNTQSTIAFCITCEGTAIWFSGFYDSEKETMSGNWDLNDTSRPISSPSPPTLPSSTLSGARSSQTSGAVNINTEKRFLMTRRPAEYARYATITGAGPTSVARKRWIFAIEATRHQVSKTDAWR